MSNSDPNHPGPKPNRALPVERYVRVHRCRRCFMLVGGASGFDGRGDGSPSRARQSGNRSARGPRVCDGGRLCRGGVHRTVDAASWATELQAAVASEPWPDGIELKIPSAYTRAKPKNTRVATTVWRSIWRRVSPLQGMAARRWFPLQRPTSSETPMLVNSGPTTSTRSLGSNALANSAPRTSRPCGSRTASKGTCQDDWGD